MKNYKLKAPIIVNILLVVCVILAGVSVGWNVFNVYEYSKVDLIKTVCFSVAIALSLLLFVFCISFFFSKYIIKGQTLICYTGFIKSKLSLNNLSVIHHVIKLEKTFLIFEDGKAIAILIDPKNLNDFTSEIIKNNRFVELRTTEDLK